MDKPFNTEDRYYQQKPEDKTLEACEKHGRDHKAYRWGPQLDPRWTDEQKAAYQRGYAADVGPALGTYLWDIIQRGGRALP